MCAPFDDPDIIHLVIVNDDRQYSMWPAVVTVPQGWIVTFGPANRDACLDHVRVNWSDLGPAITRELQ